MLFDFDIKYRVGKSNQVADALSWWPVNPDSSSESSDDEEEWETISYEVVCQILDFHLDSSKLPYTVKQEVQTNIMDIKEANSSEGFSPINVIDVQLNEVKTFDTISPSQWQGFKRKTPSCLSSMSMFTIIQNPSFQRFTIFSLSQFGELLLQFDQLSLIWGVLHCRSFT